MPRNNSNGDYLEYGPPISEMDDSCLYDKNNRVITEFSNAVNKSSEVCEIRYNPNGTISRKSYIEIDYYDIDWRALEEDSEFSVDRADEAVFESVHLDYTFDDYIYDSNDLLVRIDSYKAGANNPYHYEVFEYDDDNRVTRSYSGRYDDDFISWIDFYFYN